MSVIRGALIVLEGCDRSGKTTQAKLLVKALLDCGHKAQMLHFPERSTAIGKIINEYLEKKVELEDHAVHLLFSANRWELVPEMLKLLNLGTTLIVDRYAFSNVAFSGSKDNMDFEWCKKADVGLPKPDMVFYLDLPTDAAAQRGGYGDERYERTDFQKSVRGKYEELQDETWNIIDASGTQMDVHHILLPLVLKIVEQEKSKIIGKLWQL